MKTKMKINYIRVSTENQNSDIQKNQIEIGYSKYEEKPCSGSIPFAERQTASKIIELVNEGKVSEIVVNSLDRLGRNTLDILQTIQFFTDNEVNLICKREGLRTLNEDGSVNMVASLMVGILSTLAEFERNRLKERQREGIDNAKSKGVYEGRVAPGKTSESTAQFLNKPLSKKIIKTLKAKNSLRDTAKLCQCSLGTVQKVKGLIEHTDIERKILAKENIEYKPFIKD
jgi:DNA invertase Pin-like site-specific DNA recombinase